MKSRHQQFTLVLPHSNRVLPKDREWQTSARLLMQWWGILVSVDGMCVVYASLGRLQPCRTATALLLGAPQILSVACLGNDHWAAGGNDEKIQILAGPPLEVVARFSVHGPVRAPRPL